MSFVSNSKPNLNSSWRIRDYKLIVDADHWKQQQHRRHRQQQEPDPNRTG